MLQEHGVLFFTGPVSHPQSTGLLERKVQEMLGLIQKKSIQRATYSWSLLIRDNVLEMNTKTTKIYRFTPAQIMLGFNPVHYQMSNEDTVAPLSPDQAELMLPPHQYQMMMLAREERRLQAATNASFQEPYNKKAIRRQRMPEPGDLVIVWDKSRQNQHGRKLDPHWWGPRLLHRWANNRQSGYVKELRGEEKLRRYHVNDLILYYPRDRLTPPAMAVLRPTFPVCSSERSYYKFAIGTNGRRALVLTLYDGHEAVTQW